ncbi:HAMP domain-containing sensor histidine kinase [Bacillus sp. 31A1R]|uniref:histidine kinase n=1 Tax=Robertmurraya mangrovi TaxID=3098077 RepID=A0ABU5J3K9_9BACI|nr:HAMP domain-containing sensor histidine kinase [Bacillus sp. 31A1R]MDZ5473926.1 HAMP domain-containing sensor histidine kinase [Bacillus sp. 31A1R]
MLLIEGTLFISLYYGIVHERIEHELNNLLARGTSHREVLEKNFDQMTISHVALMEAEAETSVVITDEKYEVIQSSNEVTPEKIKLILESSDHKYNSAGEYLETRWRTEEYLATASPIIINQNEVGYVYMFLDTSIIRNMIQGLTKQFVYIGFLTVLVSLISVVFLSRFITKPLLEMKQATEKMAKGNLHQQLDTNRNDELGDLARSIEMLSSNLYTLKKDRNEFLSSISHELRTPLTYLKGYADVSKRKNLTDSERDEYLTIIEEEANHLTELVKDLFDLAKMDENSFLINKKRVNLNLFLNRMVSKVKSLFDEKKVGLQLMINREFHLNLDENRFEQVFINLLDNALKYSESNTNVYINVNKINKQIHISITDEGEGISERELPYIWDRLYRVDKSRSRATGGSGLGLPIVKEIIERHGGQITINSKLGKGTTFNIFLEEGK